MLRISSLLRNKSVIRNLPMRAGLPGWNRPDVPASATLQTDHELSDEEILFYFPDRNMPQFFLTQPEIYQGDTFKQGAKTFFGGWGLFVLTASLLGGVLVLGLGAHKDGFRGRGFLDIYERDKQYADTKQWLKWGKQNPVGLEISPEYFPTQYTMQQKPSIKERKASYDRLTKPNQQVRAYLTKLKAKCDEKVKNRHNHQNQQTAQHH